MAAEELMVIVMLLCVYCTSANTSLPELSRSERSICAMLMIGMEPGAISRICGFEHEQTFYNKRKDIRKKFGLEHVMPLESFLREMIDRMNQDRAAQVESMLQKD